MKTTPTASELIGAHILRIAVYGSYWWHTLLIGSRDRADVWLINFQLGFFEHESLLGSVEYRVVILDEDSEGAWTSQPVGVSSGNSLRKKVVRDSLVLFCGDDDTVSWQIDGGFRLLPKTFDTSLIKIHRKAN